MGSGLWSAEFTVTDKPVSDKYNHVSSDSIVAVAHVPPRDP